MVNLSNRVLSQAEVSALSKRLKFCPTPEEIGIYALKKDIKTLFVVFGLRSIFILTGM